MVSLQSHAQGTLQSIQNNATKMKKTREIVTSFLHTYTDGTVADVSANDPYLSLAFENTQIHLPQSAAKIIFDRYFAEDSKEHIHGISSLEELFEKITQNKDAVESLEEFSQVSSRKVLECVFDEEVGVSSCASIKDLILATPDNSAALLLAQYIYTQDVLPQLREAVPAALIATEANEKLLRGLSNVSDSSPIFFDVTSNAQSVSISADLPALPSSKISIALGSGRFKNTMHSAWVGDAREAFPSMEVLRRNKRLNQQQKTEHFDKAAQDWSEHVILTGKQSPRTHMKSSQASRVL